MMWRSPSAVAAGLVLTILVVAADAHRTLASTSCPHSQWEDIIERDLELLKATYVYPQHLDLGAKQIIGGWRVLIRDRKLYATPVGSFVPRKTATLEHGLLMVISKAMCRYEMPDVEFVVNGYSRKSATNTTTASVVFSCTKDPSKDQDILLPYQSMLWPRSHAESFADVNIPWEQKEAKAVWRGTTSGGLFTQPRWRHMARSRIAILCKQRPDLCDVGFSSYDTRHTTPDAMDEMREAVGLKEPISMKDMAKFKYIVAVDGFTAPTSRITHLLYSGSVIFKQESPFQEFWYNDFKPFVHYVPLSYDGSDLLQKIEWARQHDAEAHQIAQNARAYAEKNLIDENIACYVNRLLTAYAKLQRFSPRVTDEVAGFRVKYEQNKFVFLKENSDFECQYFNNQ